MTKEQQKIEEQVVTEFGVTEADGTIWRVVRSFILQVEDGPSTIIGKGQLVRLSRHTGTMCFSTGKVVPWKLGEHFKVVHPFRIAKDGLWVDLERDDLLKLTFDEAVPLLREKKIVEEKGDAE